MRRKEIKLALMYRDMWQSSGKYMPRIDQLVKVADPIIAMNCFARVETNGGGFEQINLLSGENPNTTVRAWTKPFRDAGIQTQMLERGLNGLRMSPVPLDVRRLMFQLKKIQGTDISRSFDGLNNPQNLAKSFEYAKAGGMIAQGALSITVSPVHTDQYFINLADQFIDLGAEEICIKDMAGIGRPASLGRIVKGIRERHPNIIIQYHSHTTPGFAVASALEVARNGADIIDCGMEPLSWGTGHPDVLTIQSMLKDDGFLVSEINMDAYMEVRTLTQEFIDDFLGEFMESRNRLTSSLLIGPGLPGGMMGSLMADLENNLKSLNKWLEKNNRSPMSQDQLLIKMFDEVEYAWPRLGYPPLVTPYSQYVKNVALMNAIQVIKGGERWTMLDENTWDMILGKQGELPGEIGAEIKQLASAQGKEFFTGDPQSLYPDELDKYRHRMQENGWETGEDDEELFEFAMHPKQYEAYKSGQAKAAFLESLEKKREVIIPIATHSHEMTSLSQPSSLDLDINGQQFHVKISYPADANSAKENGLSAKINGAIHHDNPKTSNGEYHYVNAPLEGKFYLTKDNNERGIKVGDIIKSGEVIGYIEAMKVINAITADKAGKVAEIVARHGSEIEEDAHIIKLI